MCSYNRCRHTCMWYTYTHTYTCTVSLVLQILSENVFEAQEPTPNTVSEVLGAGIYMFVHVYIYNHIYIYIHISCLYKYYIYIYILIDHSVLDEWILIFSLRALRWRLVMCARHPDCGHSLLQCLFNGSHLYPVEGDARPWDVRRCFNMGCFCW
jgi:hypothetical protein